MASEASPFGEVMCMIYVTSDLSLSRTAASFSSTMGNSVPERWKSKETAETQFQGNVAAFDYWKVKETATYNGKYPQNKTTRKTSEQHRCNQNCNDSGSFHQ